MVSDSLFATMKMIILNRYAFYYEFCSAFGIAAHNTRFQFDQILLIRHDMFPALHISVWLLYFSQTECHCSQFSFAFDSFRWSSRPHAIVAVFFSIWGSVSVANSRLGSRVPTPSLNDELFILLIFQLLRNSISRVEFESGWLLCWFRGFVGFQTIRLVDCCVYCRWCSDTNISIYTRIYPGHTSCPVDCGSQLGLLLRITSSSSGA